MATVPWIKLDWDWAESPEAELLRKRYGSKALLGWIQLMILMAEFDGAVNLKDEAQMDRAMKRLRRGEQKVLDLVDHCAECGLIDDDAFHVRGYATSARAQRDARAREGRRERARQNSEASKVVNNYGKPSSKPQNAGGRQGGMTPLQNLIGVPYDES